MQKQKYRINACVKRGFTTDNIKNINQEEEQNYCKFVFADAALSLMIASGKIRKSLQSFCGTPSMHDGA